MTATRIATFHLLTGYHRGADVEDIPGMIAEFEATTGDHPRGIALHPEILKPLRHSRRWGDGEVRLFGLLVQESAAVPVILLSVFGDRDARLFSLLDGKMLDPGRDFDAKIRAERLALAQSVP